MVGIGASAGGIEPLRRVVATLPRDFPGAVCVVLHIPATGPSLLAPILDREGPLEAVVAHEGARLEAGRIYVAPPDCHLLIAEDGLRLSQGPKQNGVRPAVDPLFRTMASVHGPRCAAVVLSGALDDGSGGAVHVRSRGGAVLVQDVEEALVPSMPAHALEAVPDADVLSAEGIAARLVALAGAAPLPREDPTVPDEPAAEPGPGRRPPGAASGYTCPECSGGLWEVRDGPVLRFGCRVGHSYSEQSFVAEQGSSVEAALWAALEVLEERAELLGKLVARARESGRSRTAERTAAGMVVARERADLIRRAISGFREEPLATGDEASVAS